MPFSPLFQGLKLYLKPTRRCGNSNLCLAVPKHFSRALTAPHLPSVQRTCTCLLLQPQRASKEAKHPVMEQVCTLEEYRLPYFMDWSTMHPQQQAEAQQLSLLLLYSESAVPVWESQKSFSALDTGWCPGNCCLEAGAGHSRGSGAGNALQFSWSVVFSFVAPTQEGCGGVGVRPWRCS